MNPKNAANIPPQSNAIKKASAGGNVLLNAIEIRALEYAPIDINPA